MIFVCSLRSAQDVVQKTTPSNVVSILSPASEFPVFEKLDKHLKLTFHDVAAEVPGLSAPGAHDMVKLLQFFQAWDKSRPMVIHCWAGISRSTAAAYIGLCLLKPKSDELELAGVLRQASPAATPNPLLVKLADDALGRNGKMVRAIQQIGRGADAYEGTPFSLDIG